MPLPLIAAGSLAPIIATVLKFFVAYMVTRIVVALGIALVTFAGASTIASAITSYVTTNIGGLSATTLGAAEAIGIMDAINIVLSAYVASIGIRSLKGVYNRLTFGTSSGGS